jgi:hypothetical protein
MDANGKCGPIAEALRKIATNRPSNIAPIHTIRTSGSSIARIVRSVPRMVLHSARAVAAAVATVLSPAITVRIVTKFIQKDSRVGARVGLVAQHWQEPSPQWP